MTGSQQKIALPHDKVFAALIRVSSFEIVLLVDFSRKARNPNDSAADEENRQVANGLITVRCSCIGVMKYADVLSQWPQLHLP